MFETTLRHELDCSAERYWELFFDPDFSKQLIITGMGYAECEVGPVTEEGDAKKRQMRVTPRLDLPGAVSKALGPSLGYIEYGTFDVSSKLWSFDIKMGVLTDRIRIGGKMRIEPNGERCTRVADVWTEVKIFGVGRMAERAAEKNMREGWDRSAKWTNAYLAEGPTAT